MTRILWLLVVRYTTTDFVMLTLLNRSKEEHTLFFAHTCTFKCTWHLILWFLLLLVNFRPEQLFTLAKTVAALFVQSFLHSWRHFQTKLLFFFVFLVYQNWLMALMSCIIVIPITCFFLFLFFCCCCLFVYVFDLGLSICFYRLQFVAAHIYTHSRKAQLSDYSLHEPAYLFDYLLYFCFGQSNSLASSIHVFLFKYNFQHWS